MGALEMLYEYMSMYKAHYFYYTSPDFTTSIISQSVTNNRCAPSCGGHNRKVRGYIKKIVPPHLQITSDATERVTTYGGPVISRVYYNAM